MSNKRNRTCSVCGYEGARTEVSWPPLRVRRHLRCERCWIDWWAFGMVLDWWFGSRLLDCARKAS